MEKFKEDTRPLRKKLPTDVIVYALFLSILYFGLPYIGYTFPEWAVVVLAAIFFIFLAFELIRVTWFPPYYELSNSGVVIKNAACPIKSSVPYTSIESVEKMSTDMAIEKYSLAKHKRGKPWGGAIIHFLVPHKNVTFLRYPEIVLLHIKKGEPSGLLFDFKDYPRIAVLAPENPDMFVSALRRKIE